MENFEKILDQLESGEIRSVIINGRDIQVNSLVKEAILAAFRAGVTKEENGFLEKHTLLPRKFSLEHKVRIVPGGSSIRRGAYLAPSVIVMPPSYVNVGAFVDEGTMVDSHVLVGSCAQIGKRVHLSAAVQIGGVLEPVGAVPVVVEDDAFIGAHSAVLEGVRVGRGAVLAPGVILSKAISVYDAVKGEVRAPGAAIPDYAVIIPGSRPVRGAWAGEQGLQQYCPILIKYRDEKSNASLVLEDALRS